MFDILWICLTYCIGSVPFGLVFAKTFCRIDPRTAGSGNVGATNVARLCGKAWGAATLACDLLKGTIPVFIAMQYSTSELVWTLTALAAILGHLYSCFLGFKGGKAVAVATGTIIAIKPVLILPLLAVFVIVFLCSTMVSLASICCAAAYPAVTFLYFHFVAGRDVVLTTCCAAVIGGLVIWLHRSNIQRIKNGTEYKFGRKKK